MSFFCPAGAHGVLPGLFHHSEQWSHRQSAGPTLAQGSLWRPLWGREEKSIRKEVASGSYPMGTKTWQQPPDWIKGCSRPLQKETWLTASDQLCDQKWVSDGLPSLVLRRRTTSRFVGQRTKTTDIYQHKTHGVSQDPGLTQGHSQREKSWRISEGYMSPYMPYASCYAVTHTDHTDNFWLFQLVMFFLNSPCLATLYISSLS